MWYQYQWSSLCGISSNGLVYVVSLPMVFIIYVTVGASIHSSHHITLFYTIKLAFLYTAICHCISLTRMTALSQQLSVYHHVSFQVTYTTLELSLEEIRTHPFESFGLTKPLFWEGVPVQIHTIKFLYRVLFLAYSTFCVPISCNP